MRACESHCLGCVVAFPLGNTNDRGQTFSKLNSDTPLHLFREVEANTSVRNTEYNLTQKEILCLLHY